MEHFVEHFTYLGLFLALAATGVGLPVPEEAIIVAGGLLAHQGVIRWWLALPVALAGVLAGDCLLYGAGRHFGDRILGWRAVRYVVTPDRETTLRQAYGRHGASIVFTARHVFGLRTAAFLTAGVVRLPFSRFVLVDAAAAGLSVPISFGLAYLFANRVLAILRGVHRAEDWLLFVAAVGATVWLIQRARRRARGLAVSAGVGGG